MNIKLCYKGSKIGEKISPNIICSDINIELSGKILSYNIDDRLGRIDTLGEIGIRYMLTDNIYYIPKTFDNGEIIKINTLEYNKPICKTNFTNIFVRKIIKREDKFLGFSDDIRRIGVCTWDLKNTFRLYEFDLFKQLMNEYNYNIMNRFHKEYIDNYKKIVGIR